MIPSRYRGIEKTQKEINKVLNKIRAEIKALSNANPSYWHSGDMVEREEVFEIIDKYKAESDHKCHTCEHYMSGEQDGSCDSYICKNYSDWESEE